MGVPPPTPSHSASLPFPPLQWMREHACIIKSIVSLCPPQPALLPPSSFLLLPPSSAVHFKKKKNPRKKKKRSCLDVCHRRDAETWPTFRPHTDAFLCGVATAGERECHPVLPVNYAATKLIVCLVRIAKKKKRARERERGGGEKMASWGLADGLIVSKADAKFFSCAFFLTRSQTWRWLNGWMMRTHFQGQKKRRNKIG